MFVEFAPLLTFVILIFLAALGAASGPAYDAYRFVPWNAAASQCTAT